MNLKEEILKEHSKLQTQKVVAYVGHNPARFAELMQLFFEGEYRESQRAAWAMSHIVLENPALSQPYFEQCVHFMRQTHVHDSVVRNTLRILQSIAIPENLQGVVVGICIGFILEPNKPSAIKAFAISTLQNICRQHPALASEIKLLIEERIGYEKPAFVSRAKRFLKEFD